MSLTGEDLKNIIKTHKLLTLSISVCIIAGGWLYFRSDSLPELSDDLATKDALVQRYQANIDYSEGLQDNVEEMVTINQHIQERMLHAPNLAQNLQYFYGLEEITGIHYGDLRQLPQPPKPKNSKATYTPIQFSVTIQGDYNQLLFFLQHIEAQEHFCRVVALAFRNGSTATAQGKPQLQLVLTLEFIGIR